MPTRPARSMSALSNSTRNTPAPCVVSAIWPTSDGDSAAALRFYDRALSQVPDDRVAAWRAIRIAQQSGDGPELQEARRGATSRGSSRRGGRTRARAVGARGEPGEVAPSRDARIPPRDPRSRGDDRGREVGHPWAHWRLALIPRWVIGAMMVVMVAAYLLSSIEVGRDGRPRGTRADHRRPREPATT